MGQAEANGTGQMIANSDAVFSTDLIGRYTSRISFESKEDHLEHGLQVLTRFVGRQVEVQMIRVDSWQRCFEPMLRFFDFDLRFTDRIEVFVQAGLIVRRERFAK